mgnify:CR=1 FL=1
MHPVQRRLSLLYSRLACENETLLSLLQDGLSLSQAEEILSSRTDRWQTPRPLIPAVERDKT